MEYRVAVYAEGEEIRTAMGPDVDVKRDAGAAVVALTADSDEEAAALAIQTVARDCEGGIPALAVAAPAKAANSTSKKGGAEIPATE